MNRRVDYLVTEEEINLTRGPSGLGFNIVDNRAVALDGWLQEGDKICSVNGQDLKNLLPQDAVDLFRTAGYAASLRVQHRLQVQNGPLGPLSEGEPSGITRTVLLVPLFTLTMVAIWAFTRYQQ
ncbi:hypothetical protein FD754_013361 [Muntiacus muntjak]|uniref:PDZ domain-containing protein n=1 Tax=Muntiacus muntjak TaxID=9888 RepID=A0A5N3VHB9_MUNMU|nr:hypothetical protein FD754_013361 [Muntiacus muntjak]